MVLNNFNFSYNGSARGKRLRSGSHKRLPPLETSQQDLRISNLIQVPANNKQNYSLLDSNTATLLPSTANKKRLPEKIQAINPTSSTKPIAIEKENDLKLAKSPSNNNNNPRECDTPVTIDILSESGRTSRFSYLDLITPRDPFAKQANVSSFLFLSTYKSNSLFIYFLYIFIIGIIEQRFIV